MSRLNGDKSRHQISRRRAIHRRVKTRKLLEEARGKKAEVKPKV